MVPASVQALILHKMGIIEKRRIPIEGRGVFYNTQRTRIEARTINPL